MQPRALCMLAGTKPARARRRPVLISDHVARAKWNDNDTVYRQRDSFLSESIYRERTS